MAVNFTDSEATTWPTRPDTPATRADEIINYAGAEILNAIYKQRGVSRAARVELARRISEVMGTTRMKILKELEGSI